MDRMNVEMPNWRITLFNKYYGSVPRHEELTEEEKALLKELQDKKTVIRGVMNPDNKPYSWYENGKAYGIAADIFKNTVKALNLDYEIVPVSTREEYEKIIEEGGVDIWMDVPYTTAEKNTN